MTLHEARVKSKKLLLQLGHLKKTYNNQLQQHRKALKDLQKNCPHDLVRDEERIQHCAICGKEFE
jgi:hypothetical protein